MLDVVLLVLASLASFGRMLAAYILSLLVAISLGILMARRRTAEAILMPILDVLQSIPILGFFPIAIVIFVSFLPKSIGLELAAIFLITTSLLWNMIFGVYTSVKSLDPNMFHMASVYRLKTFSRIAYIYVPAARAAIAANSIISWAGGWFFLTSAEVISAGSEEYKLLGIGSLIMDLYSKGDMLEFYIATAVLFAIIIASYLLIFNPATNLVIQHHLLPAWHRAFYYIYRFVSIVWEHIMHLGIKFESKGMAKHNMVIAVPLLTLPLLYINVVANLQKSPLFILEFMTNFLISLARVSLVVVVSFMITIVMAYLSLVKGLGPIIAIVGEILASIPAILWWPILSPLAVKASWLVSFIVFLQGSLWYEFFNVMLFGVPKIKMEVLELAKVYSIRGFNYFRYILIPSLLPSIASGALSAWGGAWNASIVAEYFESGSTTIDLGGVGSMLSKYTYGGRYDIVLYTVILWALMIVLLNKSVWSQIFKRVEKSFVVE
ncbi:MAG: ABC transporter permease subunit [Ignisphaera sp.]